MLLLFIVSLFFTPKEKINNNFKPNNISQVVLKYNTGGEDSSEIDDERDPRGEKTNITHLYRLS